MKVPTTILAIETAIGGGSISLLHSDRIDICMLEGVSRAEDLLIGIDRLLAECQTSLDALHTIAVSLGPGSFTGIRIGIATAMGLRLSLRAKCVGVSALEALKLSCPDENIVAVVPLGRGHFAFQEFCRDDASRGPKVVNEGELIEIFGPRDIKVLVCTAGEWSPPENFTVCTDPVSTLIGRCALAGRVTEDLRPLYLRNQGQQRI